jgi:hypothetical protein
MANESSVVSFPAGKPASAKNRVSNSPNYRLEQLIALRDEYRRKAQIIDYAIKLLRSRLPKGAEPIYPSLWSPESLLPGAPSVSARPWVGCIDPVTRASPFDFQ